MKVYLGRKDLFARVDEEDADLAKLSWHAHKGKGDYYYAAHRSGTAPRERRWLHNEVAERVLGRPLSKGELVDHINRDKLDNRRANLRIASRSQNEVNKAKGKRGASRYKGVSRQRDKWKAEVTVNKKRVYLGLFDDERAAAEAYDACALTYYGEFATLNFPKEK